MGSWRPHRLVRDFLLARLEAEIGPAGVIDLHRHLAAALEPRSWRLAARHWAAAGKVDEVRRVVCAAIPTIIGTGDFAAAEELMARFPDAARSPWLDIIRTRQLAGAGRYEEAEAVARRAEEAASSLALDSSSFNIGSALNRLHLGVQRRDSTMRVSATTELAASGDRELVSIARAAELAFAASHEGSLDELCEALLEATRLSRLKDHHRHEAISLLNLSFAENERGNSDAAIVAGEKALTLLVSSGDRGDTGAAHLNTAKALAHRGRWAEAQTHVTAATSDATTWVEPEVVAEAVELQAMYGDPPKGLEVLRRSVANDPRRADSLYWQYVTARLELAQSNYGHATKIIPQVAPNLVIPGFGSAVKSLNVQIRAMTETLEPGLAAELEEGLRFAERQQAWFWWKTIRLTQALVSGKDALSSHVCSLPPQDAAYLSIQAELVVRRLGDLDADALETVRNEALLRPERWRWALRQLLHNAATPASDVRKGAELLDLVGDSTDVKLLRKLAHRKSLRIPDVGRAVARREAPPAFIDDLGRVTIRIGDRAIAGTNVREKVLSLLTFLLTRPQFSASREQVIEALWPDM
jgi:tetratricopeptide (TPR) repeat protein